MDESPPEEIYVLNKRLRLLQPLRGFRTSLDSVMLAAACPARRGESLLDLGCGVGGAGLCVLFRVPDASLTGIDIQADHIALAQRNAARNAMKDRARFLCANVSKYHEKPVNHIICNPPYMEAGTYTPSPDEKKARAHGHEDTGLRDWLDCTHRNLKSGGSLTIIHRADHADKIIQGLGGRCGHTEIIPLWPHAGEAAKRVIIRAVKDRRSPCLLHPGIVLHSLDGSYTQETENILRGGAPIP